MTTIMPAEKPIYIWLMKNGPATPEDIMKLFEIDYSRALIIDALSTMIRRNIIDWADKNRGSFYELEVIG